MLSAPMNLSAGAPRPAPNLFFALTWALGDLREALAWVENCNIDKDSYYANVRRSQGIIKPHKVRYWGLGNEVWGKWQVAQQSKEEYAAKAVQWAKALKLLDPEIKLVLCGSYGLADWDRYVVRECIEWVDYHSIHYYSAGTTHEATVFSPMAAEKAIEITQSLIELARIEKGVKKAVKVALMNGMFGTLFVLQETKGRNNSTMSQICSQSHPG